MRHQLGDTVFLAHFSLDNPASEVRRPFNISYSTPYVDLKIVQTTFQQVTVTEHHKVDWEWDAEGEGKKEYDGFIAVSTTGERFVNQYPLASYGQTTTEADNRFKLMKKEWEDKPGDGWFDTFRSDHPNTPFLYRRLDRTLEELLEQIKELEETNPSPVTIASQLALTSRLGEIVLAFAQTYPDWDIVLTYKAMFKEAPDFLSGDCTFVQRDTSRVKKEELWDSIVKENGLDKYLQPTQTEEVSQVSSLSTTTVSKLQSFAVKNNWKVKS